MKVLSSLENWVHAFPTGGYMVSESKLILTPNGSNCPDVKARNSGERSKLFVASVDTSGDLGEGY